MQNVLESVPQHCSNMQSVLENMPQYTVAKSAVILAMAKAQDDVTGAPPLQMNKEGWGWGVALQTFCGKVETPFPPASTPRVGRQGPVSDRLGTPRLVLPELHKQTNKQTKISCLLHISLEIERYAR